MAGRFASLERALGDGGIKGLTVEIPWRGCFAGVDLEALGGLCWRLFLFVMGRVRGPIDSFVVSRSLCCDVLDLSLDKNNFVEHGRMSEGRLRVRVSARCNRR